QDPLLKVTATTLTNAASGTANRAPGMPAIIVPPATTRTTASGCTFTAEPIRMGCRMCPSTCWTPSTTTSIQNAIHGPLYTSARNTATAPVTTAPTIGTNAPRKTRTATGI